MTCIFTGRMLTGAVAAQAVWRPKLPSPMPQPLVESKLNLETCPMKSAITFRRMKMH